MEHAHGSQGSETRNDRPIRVLVADDQPMMITALKTILNTQDDIEVVTTAGNGREAIEAAERWRIDVAVLDIRMPHLNGIEAAQIIRQRRETTKVLMLTTFDSEDLVRRALEIGVQGFMLKDSGPEALIDAIRRIHQGASVLSPGITEFVINVFRDSCVAESTTTAPPVEPLTPRELEVLERVALAETNAEIAAHLHIGAATVKTYVSRLIAKLGVRDRVGLAVWAHTSGIVSAQSSRAVE